MAGRGVKEVGGKRPTIADEEGMGKGGETGGSGEEAGTVALTKAQRKLMQPAGCRAYVRHKLATEFAGIVQGFVKVAKTGSVPHMKLATELLKPVRKSSSRQRGSASQMLEKMKRADKERAGKAK